jgi:hypothetical protein
LAVCNSPHIVFFFYRNFSGSSRGALLTCLVSRSTGKSVERKKKGKSDSMSFSKATGNTLGRVLVLGGAGALVSAVFRTKHVGSTVAVGGLCVTVGLWLANKLYLDDPEAHKEYLAELAKKPLSQSLRDFRTYFGGGTPLSNILRFATPEDIRQLMERELSTNQTFTILVQLYDVSNLRDFVENGVVMLEWLQGRAETELMRDDNNFSTFWENCEGKLPKLVVRPNSGSSAPQGAKQSNLPFPVVRTDSLRRKLLDEYSWVNLEGEPILCAPPDAYTNPAVLLNPEAGGKNGVWRNVLAYGTFARNELGIPAALLRRVVETCPFALSDQSTMKKCVEQGLHELVELSFLSKVWVEQRLAAELSHISLSTSTLETLEQDLKLKKLILSGVIRPLVVRTVFHCGIPTREGFTFGQDSYGSLAFAPTTHSASISRENNIICFLEYWGDLLVKYPFLVPDGLQYWLNDTWITYSADLTKLKDRYKSPSAATKNQSGTGGAAAVAGPNPVKAPPSFDEALLELKRDAHRKFCLKVSSAFASGAGARPLYHGGRGQINANLNVNCSTM